MRALPALLACACAAAGRPPAAREPPACDVLPLLGKAEPMAVAADAEGGLAVAGRFEGKLRAGAASASSAGGGDFFVLRTAADGSVRWLHRLGGPAQDGALAVAVSPEGDVVVAGVSEEHCAAARLAASDGREIWVSRLEGEGSSVCRALAFDAGGDVWAAGSFSGRMRGAVSRGHSDVFVVRFSGATGEAGLVRAVGGLGEDVARAVAALPGGVLVGGQFGGEVDVSESAVDFGAGAVASAGSFDAFLLALDREGKTIWAATFGDNGDDGISAVALYGGAIYAGGQHQPAANYLGLDPRGVGNATGIVLRYSGEGRGEWVRIFEGPSSSVEGMAFDGAGRLWAAGTTKGLRAGELSIESAGKTDGYALALDPRNGEPLGARRFGSREAEMVHGVAQVPGGFAVAGTTQGELQVCGRPVGSPGEGTGFLLWLRDIAR